MKYVVIPNTDLRVSQLCLGSTDIGAAIPVPESFALMDEFVALGGNFIDTAHVYSNWIPGTKSTSEKTIGRWLQERGNRDQLVISTKGAHPEIASMHTSRLSRAEIEQDLNESLEFLQTDRIDIYWLHRDDPAVPVSDIVDILNEQGAAGKIRYLGASNWTVERIQAAADYAASKGLHSFVANQPLWSLAQPNMDVHPDQTLVAMDQAGLDFHRRTGMAVLPYSSQAHGYFTKMDRGDHDKIARNDQVVFENETNMKRLARVQELARKYKAQINDIVLAYLHSQPFVTIPLIGSKRIDQLRSSVNALELTLTSDELAYLESA
jgi:aryl-alcohol dehydrogenase-like predicted oxidoreductase